MRDYKMVIYGKEIAKGIIELLKLQPTPQKILAAVLVGENPQSISFLKQKEKTAKELKIDFRVYKLSAGLKNDGLRREIGRIARQRRVGGIIVQLPLPEGLNRRYVLNAIPPEKDIEVLSEKARELFRAGGGRVLPPAVGVVAAILAVCKLQPITLKAAIVGTGFLTGKPISEWLKDRTKELKIFEEGSNLDELKCYDLVISGVGRAGLIKPEMLKNGAIVIDFGYSIKEMGDEYGVMSKKISGDLATGSLESVSYTPTPGGTGPILVAKLMENFYKLNKIT